MSPLPSSADATAWHAAYVWAYIGYDILLIADEL